MYGIHQVKCKGEVWGPSSQECSRECCNYSSWYLTIQWFSCIFWTHDCSSHIYIGNSVELLMSEKCQPFPSPENYCVLSVHGPTVRYLWLLWCLMVMKLDNGCCNFIAERNYKENLWFMWEEITMNPGSVQQVEHHIISFILTTCLPRHLGFERV